MTKVITLRIETDDSADMEETLRAIHAATDPARTTFGPKDKQEQVRRQNKARKIALWMVYLVICLTVANGALYLFIATLDSAIKHGSP